MSWRVLVTGSRNWRHPGLVLDELDAIAFRRGATRLVIVHGDCPDGVDAVANRWAKDNGATPGAHPGDWKTYGKRAGFVRNDAMVKLGADECVAFIARCTQPGCTHKAPHGSHGATNCAELAEAALIITRRWTDLR